MIPCSLQQARDVVNGLAVTFVVLKKEGEAPFYSREDANIIVSIGKFEGEIDQSDFKTILEVGSPVAIGVTLGSAFGTTSGTYGGKNEYWYCPNCKKVYSEVCYNGVLCNCTVKDSFEQHSVLKPVLPIVLSIEQKKLNEINGEEAIRAGYPKPRVNKDNPFLGHGGDALNSLKWNIHVDNGLKFENGQFLNPEVFVIEVKR